MDHAQCRILPDQQSAALVASAGNVERQSHVDDAARVQPTKHSERSPFVSKSDTDSDISTPQKSKSSSDAGTEHQRIVEDRNPRPPNHQGLAPKANNHHVRRATNQASEPVLVHASPSSARQRTRGQGSMRSPRKTNPDRDPKQLPNLDSFTFQDIFASLDPEVKKSVDTIAEIYGRSRMSLADQHANHLPPQANLDLPFIEALNISEDTNPHRLEPVQEAPKHAGRAHCLNLAGASSHNQSELSSSPMAATSKAVTYRSFPSAMPNSQDSRLQDTMSSEDGHSSSLSHIVAWLKHLSPRHADLALANDSNNNSSASQSLRKVLGDP